LRAPDNDFREGRQEGAVDEAVTRRELPKKKERDDGDRIPERRFQSAQENGGREPTTTPVLDWSLPGSLRTDI
jgi:hypothetical protein